MEMLGRQSSTVCALCTEVFSLCRLYSPWCWITDDTVEATRLKIGSEYAFFWLAAAVSAVLYGIIVFRWFKEGVVDRDRRLIRDAMAMGWWVS